MIITRLTPYTGGGIVYDSDPYDEWMETMNKLRANMTCIIEAERRHAMVTATAASLTNEVVDAPKEKLQRLVHPIGAL